MAQMSPSRAKHVVVVVLGDLGRSPRMCFHALSLAEYGYRVTLVGYAQSQLNAKLIECDAIR